MATGRTLATFQKVYISGYDMSAYIGDSGEQGIEYPPAPSLMFGDGITGYLLGKPTVSIGPLNGVFDNTASSGLHVLADAAQGTVRNIMLLQGIQAAPAFGDDVFCIPAYQTKYKATQAGGMSTVNLTLSGPDVGSAVVYDEFWGKCLHLMGSETGANSANTNVNNLAATTAGGWLMYQITSITGTGTATVSVDDSANGTSWAALSGATSGAIATASAPTSGIIQLGTTATVRQYLRWQLALGGSATACSFALAFMRGR